MIAIICGAGEYPFLIAQESKKRGDDFVLIFLKGIVNTNFLWPEVMSITIYLGEVGKALDFCAKHKVDKIIMAGGVTRPNLLNLALDSEGRKWLMKLGKKIFLGDDGLLRAISDLFKEHGMEVISGHDFLNNDFELITEKRPSYIDDIDIQKGMEVLKALGNYDVGQSIIVENGLVLGIEGVEGTDQLILRVKDLRKTEKGGVLIKASKASQDLRMDMPTIGIKTLENAYFTNLNGIAIEKGKCIVLNRKEIIDFANKHEMFIVEI